MFLLLSTSSGILSWRHSNYRFEVLRQVALITKTNCPCNLDKRQRCSNQAFSPQDPNLRKIVMRGKANGLTKDTQQVKRTQIDQCCQLIQRDVFGEVLLQIH